MLVVGGSIFLGLYFFSLVSFSFVSHPVGYCALLVLNAVSVCGYLFVGGGVTWYLLLFCLVYVGGVYVLFIFVSVQNPNLVPMSSTGTVGGSLSLLVFIGVFCYLGVGGMTTGESSHYLCTLLEGFTYCFLCLVVLVGFSCVSVVTGSKGSFYR